MNSAFARFLLEVWCINLRHRLGTLKEAVAHLRLAVDEDALPGHRHVVEDGEPVALVEARRQRKVHRRGSILMHDRGSANKAQPRAGDRDREPERVWRRLRIGSEKGRRHHQNLVGIGAQGRDHAGARDHDPGIGLFGDLGGEVFLLAHNRARAVDLRIEQRVRHAQISLAGEDVIGADIVGKSRVTAAELRSRSSQRGQHDIEEIGAAAKHAAGSIHPGFDHAAAVDQILDQRGSI